MTWLVSGLKDSLVYIKHPTTGVYHKLTDHNRSPLGISVDEISNSQRTANGTMRKNIIAQKHTFNFSWNDVPNTSTYTIDAGWGAGDIYNFYLNNKQPFYIRITQKINPTSSTAHQEFLVNFTNCSMDVVKRNPSATVPYIRMNINLTLEEV